MTTPASRVLVLGATGMLGHRMILDSPDNVEVWASCRRAQAASPLALGDKLLSGLDASDIQSAAAHIDNVNPDVVVNCVGIVKQRDESHDPVPSILVNSLFPQRLALECRTRGIRLIHLSTDCVFSGNRGSYTETDLADPPDVYGRSKLLGEVCGEGCLTIRTSMIGWQLTEPTGLVEWFAENRSKSLFGYTDAWFSGLTTSALARVLWRIALAPDMPEGIRHLSAERVDKYTLLNMLRDLLGWDTAIAPVDEPHIDRSLDSTRLRAELAWSPPTWEDMLTELASQWDWYEKVRPR